MPGAVSYAAQMDRLLRTRAAQQPLPDGFMRCPLNPAHQVPISAIVEHMEKAHAQDGLALAPGAMYGTGTLSRRRAFLGAQLLHYHHHYHGRRRSGRSRSGIGNSNDRSDCSAHGQRRSRCCRVSSSTRSSCSSRNSRSSTITSTSRSRSTSSSSSSSSESRGGEVYRRTRRMRHEPAVAPMHSVLNCMSNAEMNTVPNVISTAEWNTPANSVLVGYYKFGQTIGRQALMDFLHTLGPLRRCDFHPQRASFTVEYDSPIPAAQWGTAVQSFLIDGVVVDLRAMQQHSLPYEAPHVPQPQILGQQLQPQILGQQLQPQILGQQLQPQTLGQQLQPQAIYGSVPPTHSIIKVGGKPIGVAVLGDRGQNSVAGIRGKPLGPECSRSVVVAELPGTKTVDERRIWEEFSRFGTVTHFTVAGPRVVVEFAAPESVESASRALRGGKHFTCCVPLKERL